MNLGKEEWEVDQETDGKMRWERMEEAPENSKESSHSAHDNGMNGAIQKKENLS